MKHTKAQVWFCVILNQIILPGLGSLYIGRTSPGTFQLGISVAGLIILLFTQWLVLSAIFILVSWVWALLTSIHVVNSV